MRRRKMGSKALRAICTVYGSMTSMDLITSRFTPNRMPAARLIWRSKLNFTSSARSSPKPLWNCTPLLSLNVHTVPSDESVQLSARSDSTSAVVTLPSLMAKRVRPRNMKRAIAWLCPRVLACGSRLSGSLDAMFSTFFRWASARGGSTRAVKPNVERRTIAATSVSGSREGVWLDMGSPISPERARAVEGLKVRSRIVEVGRGNKGQALTLHVPPVERAARDGRLLVHAADLRALQPHSSHEPLLVEDERVDIALSGRRGEGLGLALIEHDNARAHTDLEALALAQVSHRRVGHEEQHV